MGDEVRVTVIAAGFDRWDDGHEVTSSRSRTPTTSSSSSPVAAVPPPSSPSSRPLDDVDYSRRRNRDLEDLDSEDEFDVPSFLK